MPMSRKFSRAVSLSLVLALLVMVVPGASAFAVAGEKEPKRLREMIEYRGRNAKYFLNDDGSRTVEVFNAPTHVMDTAGKWIDWDYRLRKSGQQYKAGNGEARISLGERSAGYFASVSDGSHALQMGLVGAHKVTGVPEGDFALKYPQVLQGVDARYTVTSVGFKEEIILADRKAAREFAFEISTPGLVACHDTDRNEVVFSDSSNHVVFRLDRPVMWDAKQIHSSDIRVEVSSNKKPGDWLIRYIPSASYLDDPRITYPVTVDPCISLVGQHPEIQEVTWEDLIRFGVLEFGLQFWHDYEGEINERILVCALRYGLSGIPQGTISSAKMRLYIGSQGYYWARLTSAWSESDLTPGVPVDAQWGCAAYSWVEHEITATLQNWLSGTWENGGYYFYTTSTDANFNSIVSSHYADSMLWPRLVVTYTPTYGVTWVQSNTPVNMTAGQQYPTSLLVVNNGAMIWAAGGSEPVKMCYHWLDSSGNTVVQTGIKSTLPYNVPPGTSVTVAATVQAPSTAGNYTLRWDLIHDKASPVWFSSQQCPVLDVQVQVGSAVPPSCTVTSPGNGQTVSGVTNVTARVDGMTATSVEFRIDGYLVSTDTTHPYEYSWNTTSYSNGLHSIVARAIGGSSVDSPAVQVTVQNIIQPQRLGLESFWHYLQYRAGAGTAYLNICNGNLVYQNLRLGIPGRMTWVTVRHTYNSQDASSGFYGRGWDIGPNIRLQVSQDGITHVFGDGTRRYYMKRADGTYAPPPGVHDSLVVVAGGYEITTPKGLRYSFTSGGRLTSVRDRNNNVTSYAWDGSGRLLSITEPAGRQVSLGYDANGRISSISDWSGRTVTLVCNANGYLVSASGPSSTETYEYDGNGRLAAVNGPRSGQRTTFTYDSSARPTQVSRKLTASVSAVASFVYDSQNRTLSVTDPRSQVWVYGYNEAGNITCLRNPLNHQTAYQWMNNHPASQTGPLGDTRHFTYDGNGNMLSAADPYGNMTRWTYDSLNNPLSMTDALGFHSDYSYYANGNLQTVTDPLGNVTSFQYNAYGQMTRVTDPKSHATQYAYSGSGANIGFLVSTTDTNGKTTTFLPDARGNNLTVTNALSKSTTYTYDSLDRVLTITDPLSHSTQYTYGLSGNPVQIRDANNHTTTFEYDLDDKPVRKTNALGTYEQYVYSATGELTSVVDAAGKTWSAVYDGAGRLSSTTNPLGYTTYYQHDAAGRQTRITQAVSYVTQYAYDLNGRLTSVTNPLGYVTNYTYDQLGSLVEVENPRGFKRRFAYDANRRMLKDTDAEGYFTSYTYDAAGNLASKTDAKGQTITYTYDSVNRLTAKNYPNSTSATYSYDDIARMTGASWDNHAFTFGYDDANRLTSTIDRDYTKGYPFNLSYQYDNKGNRTQLQWAYSTAGNTIAYTYDAADRLCQVASAGKTFTYTYDPRDLVARLDYPNNKYMTYEYNNAGWLTRIAGNAIDISYSYYDMRGLITGMTAPQANGEHWDLVYDAAGQLLYGQYENSSHQALDSHSWTYDPNGNRGPGQFSPTDKADYIGTTYYRWDPNGNMISDRTYDYENRLTTGGRRYNAFDQERNYVYDEGREIVHVPAGVYASYVRGLNGELLMELDGGNNSVNYYAFCDHQGSIMARANSSGTIDGYAKYDPFGKVLTAVSDVPFGFAGARYDSDLGSYALGARRYDPTLGRFTTRDTWPSNVWEPWTWNLYQYCKNSPQNYVDPTGHYTQESEGECPQYLPDGTPTWYIWEQIQAALASATEVAGEVRENVIKALDLAVGGAATTLTLAAWLHPGFRQWALTGVAPAQGVLGFVAGGAAAGGADAVTAAMNALSPNNIHHILLPQHAWGRVVSDPNSWTEVSRLVEQTMRYGKYEVYKSGVPSKVYEVGAELIQVTYQMVKGILRIGDAWVKTR